MGATTWDYFTDYEADADAALQKLREKVFREGKYERFTFSTGQSQPVAGKPGEDDPSALMEWQMMKRQEEEADELDAMVAELAGSPRKPRPDFSKKPQTIDDLLEEQGESGTHSILDIQGVSPEPEFGAVCPMPVERLQELFGTDQPTRKMVEEKQGDEELIEDPLVSERWQGVYFTVYRDGRPDEIYFIGTSGD